jgi:transmembrane protein 222
MASSVGSGQGKGEHSGFGRIPAHADGLSDEESGEDERAWGDDVPRPSTWAAPEIVKEVRGASTYQIDVRRSRFPYAITWTPLPMITWILPFIGHMGIADSRGVIYDFAGPYTIGVDNMAFSKPTRYLVLDPNDIPKEKLSPIKPGGPARAPREVWDEAIDAGAEVYCRRMHNICCDNCHSHVARCLNIMAFKGSKGWNMVNLAALIFFRGKFVSTSRAIQTWLQFLIMVAIFCIVGGVVGGRK